MKQRPLKAITPFFSTEKHAETTHTIAPGKNLKNRMIKPAINYDTIYKVKT